MKIALFIFSAAIIMAPLASATAEGDDYKSYGSISDLGLRAIEAAEPEFIKQRRSIEPYSVNVAEYDGLLNVTFCAASQKQTASFVDGDGKVVAEWPRCPGAFTVELDRTSLKIIKTHYNRD